MRHSRYVEGILIKGDRQLRQNAKYVEKTATAPYSCCDDHPKEIMLVRFMGYTCLVKVQTKI